MIVRWQNSLSVTGQLLRCSTGPTVTSSRPKPQLDLWPARDDLQLQPAMPVDSTERGILIELSKPAGPRILAHIRHTGMARIATKPEL